MASGDSPDNLNISPPLDSPDSEFDELQFPESDDEVKSHHSYDDETVEIGELETHIPFRTTHDEQFGFDDPRRRVFIPAYGVDVKITNAMRLGHNLLSPHVYEIGLTHGPYHWSVRRRYKHFQSLHHNLQMFRTTIRLPIPTKKHKLRRKTLGPSLIGSDRQLPRFPKKSDAMIIPENLPNRMKQLEDYLQNVLSSPLYRSHRDTLNFLEVSQMSFVDDMGKKLREGLVQKRAGGHRVNRGLQFIMNPCRSCFGGWGERWLLLKDTCVAYIRPQDGLVQSVILMDNDFNLMTGMYQTGVRNGLLISNLTRKLLVMCPSNRSTREWYDDIMKVVKDTGRPFIQPNRFTSYAPIRPDTQMKWFVDAAGYFEAVADGLEAAREEIFITDWMLSPEIFLKRPSVEGQKWRLDKILQRKAAEGVKIFVMLYKEVEMALGINSLYSKQRLVEQHPFNIKVLRHPDISGIPLMWAHHEKLVVIDQTYAFLGGIDLAYGRWDTYEHRLTDLGGVALPKGAALNTGTSLTKSSSASNVTGFGAFNIYQLAHATQDITLNSIKVENKEHQKRWRRHRRNPSLDNIDILAAHLKPVEQKMLEESRKESANEDYGATGDVGLGNTKIWIGKDYVNFIIRDFVRLDLPFQDLVDRMVTPRMPWHDVGVMVQGKAARDVARHFILRWNYTKSTKAREHLGYPWLLPKSYDDLDRVPSVIKDELSTANCQILRSLSQWSGGVKYTQDSIQQAYLYAIDNSKRFIYIENQFFVTQAAGNKDVINKIGEALYQRIVRAHKEGTPFKVIVVMPLLPAFEGQIGTTGGTAIQAVTHWNYASICRGPDSLCERLIPIVEDPFKYVTFYGLRTHSTLNDNVVTELIYVHSKMLIVDDTLAIIGSANLNDRSMIGRRDSEMAVVFEDTEFEKVTSPEGRVIESGVVVSMLRKRVFSEFLGIMKENPEGIDLSDPTTDSFYKEVWMKTASRNTAIYEKVFRCIPTDSVTTFVKLQEYQAQIPFSVSDSALSKDLLREVRGYLVKFPLLFLNDEDLTPATGTKEALLPTQLWI